MFILGKDTAVGRANELAQTQVPDDLEQTLDQLLQIMAFTND